VTAATAAVALFRRLAPTNPVLTRELRQRMRGRLTWLVFTAYLAVLSFLLGLAYLGARTTNAGVPDPLKAAETGRLLFESLLLFIIGLVCFLVPGLTAAAISGERDRQTLVSLQVTLLSARSIVGGKLLASLAFVLLLLVASLPMLSIPFLIGGVPLVQVLVGVAVVVFLACVLACLALACSAVLRRTQAATVVAYGLTLALVVGTPLAFGAQALVRRDRQGPPNRAVLLLNPFLLPADAVRGPQGGNSVFAGLEEVTRPVGFLPFWLASLAASGALGGSAFVLAVRRLTVPAARDRS
jgi:ABC-type transport system involved in multi-copper enzyme maturation permease subunit